MTFPAFRFFFFFFFFFFFKKILKKKKKNGGAGGYFFFFFFFFFLKNVLNVTSTNGWPGDIFVSTFSAPPRALGGIRARNSRAVFDLADIGLKWTAMLVMNRVIILFVVGRDHVMSRFDWKV